MTTASSTPPSDTEVIERVLELDAKAVRGPWRLTAGYEARTIQVELPCINGLRAWFTIASVQPSLEEQEWTEGALNYPESSDRATLIAEYRTVAPDLARRLQAALTRISTLEQELGASDAALIAVGREYIYRGEDTGSIRDAIEAARRRSTT